MKVVFFLLIAVMFEIIMNNLLQLIKFFCGKKAIIISLEFQITLSWIASKSKSLPKILRRTEFVLDMKKLLMNCHSRIELCKNITENNKLLTLYYNLQVLLR